jgi:hypothetical protein
LRFSLLGLLLLTTGIAITLGAFVYQQRPKRIVPTAATFANPIRVVTEEVVLPDGRKVQRDRAVVDTTVPSVPTPVFSEKPSGFLQ